MSVSRPRSNKRPKAGARKHSKESSGARFAFLLGCLCLLFTIVGVRLFWVQVVQAGELTRKAHDQRLRDIQIPSWRGTIYDREGEPLAQSVAAKTIFADPLLIKDKAAVAATLAQVLGGKLADYQQKLQRHAGFVYIERKVDLKRAGALQNLKIEGLGFIDDSRRIYPSGTVAAQVLGFVGTDNTGLAGIEAEYNSVLAGKPGVLLAELDRHGDPIPGGVQKSVDPQDGSDVVLTIDKAIQFKAETDLAAAVKAHKAKAGSVVVINPKNGEIYAIASYPTFNPNDFSHATAASMRLMPITDAYEPGSTIKCLTAASAINEHKVTPSTKFVLPPQLHVAGRTIHDSESRGTVDWTLTQIVTNSSNIGAVRIGQRLGAHELYRCFRDFGLSRTTGVDFPGEAFGWMPPARDWSSLSMANIPFGQGVSATPLQLCRAIAGIADGGRLPTPHLLLSLPQDPKGAQPSVIATKPAISAAAASQTVGVMQHVVTEGTGKAAKVNGYTVAGKTGTAQVALPNGLGYAKGSYNSSFIGFLPVNDPQVLVCVILYQPQSGYYGGQVAAPVFSSIAQFAVAHLHVQPSSAVTASAAAATASSTAPPTPRKRASGSTASHVNSGVTSGSPTPKKP